MRTRTVLGALAFSVIGMGVLAAPGRTATPTSEPLYVSPIADDLSVRFVENHIVIDRPADKVFDWLTTPKNMTRWFPQMNGWDVVKGGPADQPQKQGDITMESIGPIPSRPELGVLKNQYTVVSLIPGFQWTAASQIVQPDGKVSPNVGSVAIWTVKALPGGKTLFIRLFESVRPDPRVAGPNTFDTTQIPRKGTVVDPAVLQVSMVRAKQLIEADLPKK
jgi:Polyketide cyclase / dehydrase and lipid transport